MKKIIVLLSITLITMSCFAQKLDTLKVDVCKYSFIKIGDKVYKIVTNLEEVKPELQADSAQILRWPFSIAIPDKTYTVPTLYYNNASSLK